MLTYFLTSIIMPGPGDRQTSDMRQIR